MDRFKNIYQNILDNPKCQEIPQNFEERLNNYLNSNQNGEFKIDIHRIKNSIKELKGGRGHDQIYSEHLKLLNVPPLLILAKLCTAMISHSYIPKDMLIGIIRPKLKNKTKNINSSDNFRPIMNSSVFYKLFDICIKIEELDIKVKTDCRQFGFKKSSSCSMATSLVQEVIEKYTNKNSDVLAAFIDLSKAYDRVNNNILIDKLIHITIHPNIIKIIKYVLHI